MVAVKKESTKSMAKKKATTAKSKSAKGSKSGASAKADTLMSNSEFFSKYEKSKDELDEQMSEWESCQSKMEVLLKER